jgi:tripartite-type tricarboxylate transporter receptor subunit TctC
MFPGLAAALPHIRSGRVRPLALTGAKRHPLLPDVPTLIESGLAGFDAQQWYGVVGPAAIPAPIVKQLNETLATVLAAPDMRDKLAVEAIEPMPQTADEFGRYIRAEITRWTALARERHIELDS